MPATTPQSPRLYYYTDWVNYGWFANPNQFRKQFPQHGRFIARICCPEDIAAPAGYRKTGKGYANDPAERISKMKGFVKEI